MNVPEERDAEQPRDSPAQPAQPLPAAPLEALLGGPILVSSWVAAADAPPAQNQAGNGPGLLPMTFSAAQAIAQFVASGFKMVTPEIRQKRLEVCATCEHYTGVRCKKCGCFARVKARMAHGRCPLGKWPV